MLKEIIVIICIVSAIHFTTKQQHLKRKPMKIVRLLGTLMLLCALSVQTNAQTTCPPNIDFEFGNLSNWTFGTGLFTSMASLTTGVTTGPAIACRHTLTTATGLVGCAGGATDPIGGFPILAPGSGSYSFRLGNNSTGRQIDRATYFVHVPPGLSNFSMIYRYATVLQDPSHSATQQPRFLVRAFDSATLAPVPCANYTYVVNSSLPGFISVGNVRYLPWKTGALDLSGMAGTTVAVEFTTTDCALGGHYGYAYVDLSCGLFEISNNSCDTLTPPSLSAPPGFQTYTWYDSATFTTFYGTGQNITIPTPPGPVTIAVILTPYPGFGCPDTLYSHVTPAHMALHPSNDTAICAGSSVVLNPNATDIALPLTYSWAPAAGLSCTTCANPIASPATTTAYTVTVTNTSGCTQDHVFNVTILPPINTTISIDTPSCNGYNNGAATVTAATGTGPYSYLWTTTPPQTTATATGLAAGTYSVMVMDTLGCTDTTIAVVPDPAPRVISVAFTNPTTCLGNEGSITITGMVQPDTTYTISYKVNGVLQTQTITADASGQIILANLIAGIYSDITIINALCPYNIAGPVVLVDPPNPDLSGVTSNSFLCVGDTLLLFANSATTGVTWLWNGPAGFTEDTATPMLPTVTLANAGTYTVTVSKNNCFTDTSIVVEVRPLPIPSASSNAPICPGETLYLYSSSANGATSYSWSGPGFTSMVQNPQIANVQPAAIGTYTVDVTLNGCTVPDTVSVMIFPVVAPVTGTKALCQYTTTTLDNATPAGIWLSSDSATASIDASGIVTGRLPGTAVITYMIPATTCKVTAVVTVDAAPDAHAYIKPDVCVGDTITLALNSHSDNAYTYTWLLDGAPMFAPSQTKINVITANVNTGGPYVISWVDSGLHIINVKGISQKGCEALPTADTVKVHTLPDPRFDVSQIPDKFCVEDSILFNAHVVRPEYSYMWEPEHFFVNQNTPEIWGRVERPNSRITLTVTDPFGCRASYFKTLNPDECCTVSLPTAFTPNGDGRNDVFRPMFAGYRRFHIFRVVNRWGHTVFESANSNPAWDGTWNGVKQDMGTYFYYLKFDCGGEVSETKGDVTLIR